jgi:hypothetical protein
MAIGYTQLVGYTQLHGYRVYTVHSYMAIGYTHLSFVSLAGQSMWWP